MFKSLELNGFKSFADRTRFDFPPGVTVVVGPNGSGKSNIVDAVKWVLGAQSVKSLRGKEMADVIFSGSGARRAINTAEATLTLDNADGQFAVDTTDVQITRRVFRSGEGEYLINRQPCRLRDIKELFAGTGIATEAYSIIEQGKVDVLLQSSPRDRRIIFEEAAGISRFKAKKVEAERRLARVGENLLRLSDIVDEVDSRLRSLRTQAAKARRYRACTQRLQELRTQVAASDWRRWTRSLDALSAEIEQWTTERDRHAALLDAGEEQTTRLDALVMTLEERVREREARLLAIRREIAEVETQRAHRNTRAVELSASIATMRRRLSAMSVRAGGDIRKSREAAGVLADAEDVARRHAVELARVKSSLRDANDRLNAVQTESDRRRAEYMEMMRAAASLGNQISVLRSQHSSASAAEERCEKQIAALSERETSLTSSLAASETRLNEIAVEAEGCAEALRGVRKDLVDARRRLTLEHKEVASLVGARTGAAQRAEVLAELERRLEGVGAGVRAVLDLAKREPDGPFGQVRGLIADRIHVNVETAALVEIALGDKANYIVLASSDEIVQSLDDVTPHLRGRVHFLRLDEHPPAAAIDRVDLSDQPGVIGRLDQMVESDPEFIPLLRRLLGRTWLVDSWKTARRLADGAGRGLNFVTSSGQRLAADGTISAGPKDGATGLLSRRSELRSLEREMERLDGEIADREQRATNLETGLGELDRRVEALSPKHATLTSALSEHRLKTVSIRDQCEQVTREREALVREQRSAKQQAEFARRDIGESETKLHAVDEQLATLEKQLESDGQTIARLRDDASTRQKEATERQVAAATSLQRVDTLRSQVDQLQRDQQERSDALEDARRQLDDAKRQRMEIDAELLDCTTRCAELYPGVETLAAEVTACDTERGDARAARRRLSEEMQATRGALRSAESSLQEKQLAAANVRQQRDALVERLRDEYGVELSETVLDGSDVEAEALAEAEKEIQSLRRKLSNIGAVNLQALEELEDLENRSARLTAQHDDLMKAKTALEQIIARINTDSRKMFDATIETVRGHFQSLFQKLFGGGQADIVLDLEETSDILECGIEIIARPPGKEPRSISLLSGGEKTLTCVALLLAIFRSKPSPFCILDEVDAALDEANIERFTAVLREFLSSTQFIVITHSKKTMVHADTLYGVTMQESGVSKQVSVRFEDVRDDGSIRESARKENSSPTSPDDDETAAA